MSCPACSKYSVASGWLASAVWSAGCTAAGSTKRRCRLPHSSFFRRCNGSFRVLAVAGRDGAHVLLVRAELARALICDPGVELTHTYRRRSLPPRLRCISTPFPNCAEPSRCPVAGVEPFIRDGACPGDGCVVTPGAVLERAEQKLVDSMITIDLVHLAEATSECLVVVSADDDLWPGIRFVLLRGAQVVHVVPRRGGSTSDRYRGLKTGKYAQVAI